jgi:S1-C subfamily serine protease
MDIHAFSWAPGADTIVIPGVPSAPHAMEKYEMNFGFGWAGSSWYSMELIELNAGLGKYFGTDTGLLVVSAPKSDALELQDGDVIQSIDGREPKDTRHAMRILSSYKSGEKLKLGIMRDKKKRTLEVEIPEDHVGQLLKEFVHPVRPARAPLPATPPRVPVASPDNVAT